MTSLCPGKNVFMHTPRKFHGFEREITKIEGGCKFPLSFVLEFFFYGEHRTCKSPCSNLALFRVHLQYLGCYVHFVGINSCNSNSNNRCMKGAQEWSGKPCLCYLVHSHAFYKEWADISRKCVAIVNHKRVVY